MDQDISPQSPQQSKEPELLNAPLLAKVRPSAPSTLFIERRDGGRIVVDLGPSITSPESQFATLQDQEAFAEAQVADDGTAVMWPRLGLTISSKLLHSIAAEQFRNQEKGAAASDSVA